MPPEAAEVRGWLEKASRDRRTAEAALQQRPPITDTAAFHVQQAVQKTLKAYLVWRVIEFERIHDLEVLVDRCAADDPSFAVLRDRVSGLTPVAVRYRYPGPVDPLVEQVRAALEIADEVWTFVTGRMPPDLTPRLGATVQPAAHALWGALTGRSPPAHRPFSTSQRLPSVTGISNRAPSAPVRPTPRCSRRPRKCSCLTNVPRESPSFPL